MSRSSSPRSSSLTDQHSQLRHGHPQVPPSHEDVPQEACRASRRGYHRRRQERRLDYQEVCRTSSTRSKLIRMFSLIWSCFEASIKSAPTTGGVKKPDCYRPGIVALREKHTKQQRYGGGNKRSQFDRIGLNCIILEATRRSRLSKFALSWRRNQGNGARTIRDDGNQPEFKLKQYDYFGYELTSFHSSDSK